MPLISETRFICPISDATPNGSLVEYRALSIQHFVRLCAPVEHLQLTNTTRVRSSVMGANAWSNIVLLLLFGLQLLQGSSLTLNRPDHNKQRQGVRAFQPSSLVDE